MVTQRHEPAGQTLQEQTYQALRRAILDGDFVPGRTMTIRGIANDLDVSAMPVREALRRLVAERALVLSATGRVSVPVMRREKLAELVKARICLERQAAIDAVPAITDAIVKRLRSLNEAIDRAIGDGDCRRYLVTHRDFHFCLYRLGTGGVFLPLIESIWLQISPFLRYTLSAEHLMIYNTSDRHLEIIAAVEARDANALGFAVEADIRQGIGALMESDWNPVEQGAADNGN
jgi:DNA-binding GntR family transcriptional regulator